MEIKPVNSLKTPGYPLKEEVTTETLKAQAPQRWSNNAAAKIALGTLAVMSLAGCTPEPPLAGVPLPPEMSTEETASCVSATPVATYKPTAGLSVPTETPVIAVLPEGDPVPPTINIAPLFEHGEGLGAFGCVMVAPPVFLSESEALSVINEVAKDYNLEFSQGGDTEFYNVRQPAVNTLEPEKIQPSETMMTMAPDFTEKQYSIAIEFVSVDDIKDWDPNYDANGITEIYATKDAADQLSDALEEVHSNAVIAAGVMYDPCEFSAESEEETRTLSVKQLKSQARDFFEWLKKQGVI